MSFRAALCGTVLFACGLQCARTAALTNVVSAQTNLHATPYSITLRLSIAGSGATRSITLQRRSVSGLTYSSSATNVAFGTITKDTDNLFTVVDTGVSPGVVYVYSGTDVNGEYVVGAADRSHSRNAALLVVAQSAAAAASAVIDSFALDLQCDGYRTERVNLNASATIYDVRNIVQSERTAATEMRCALFLSNRKVRRRDRSNARPRRFDRRGLAA